MSKIGLGTVQFGITYGLNSVPAPSGQIVHDIMDSALKDGIDTLDTSFGYGCAEQVIGNTGLAQQFKIVSKYSSKEENVLRSYEISANRLNVQSLYGYLVHYFDLYKENKSLWNDFLRLRDERNVQRIGFSIYDAEELEVLLRDKVDFNILQIPYNILDTEFLPYLQELHDRGVEIHVRSVYLQGLLFKKAEDLPGALHPLAKYLNDVRSLAEEMQVSVAELALNYVLNNTCIDKVILGVHTLDQMKRNLRSVRELPTKDIHIPIREEDQRLLKPKNWKL